VNKVPGMIQYSENAVNSAFVVDDNLVFKCVSGVAVAAVMLAF